ncbi:MAG: hypothetical protein SF051_10250 [Elusimicrobiota bacterium]|nr:hypothetical protein [Elusimicrobiota bacterium]
MSRFKESARSHALRLLAARHPVFEGASGGGRFIGKPRPFVLTEPDKNLFAPIRHTVPRYFRENGISSWGGRFITGHVLSSQVACLNHLFPLRDDKEAVTAMLQVLSRDLVEPLLITTDAFAPAYIQFESVSDGDLLHEGPRTRGSQCTSIDALIYARHRDGSRWLVPIEWKYTEHYGNQDKSLEGGAGGKGEERRSRYDQLIRESACLKAEGTRIFYIEPFYQLMRQTLWAEQVIAHSARERLKADHFLHVHVVPSANADLLAKAYPHGGRDMESTWRRALKDPSRYLILEPSALLNPLRGVARHADHLDYLQARYNDTR